MMILRLYVDGNVNERWLQRLFNDLYAGELTVHLYDVDEHCLLEDLYVLVN